MCDKCYNKDRCPFYEKGAEECVYDAMAHFADVVKKRVEDDERKKKEKNTRCL